VFEVHSDELVITLKGVLPSLPVLANFGMILMVTRTYDRNRGQMTVPMKISLLKKGGIRAPFLDAHITDSTLFVYFYINSALQNLTNSAL
jgi:hypothetical protein